MDRASGGETEKVHHSVQISPIIGGYRIPGSIQGTSVTLLLDTGAAVTLLRHDVWMGITAQPSDLKPWSGATLVSAGGEPLTTHGCTCLPLKLGGRTLEIEFVVASPLTSEAIFGVDFLQAQQATIDMGEGVLHLKKSSCDIALDPPPLGQPLAVARPVRSSDTVEVPPRSVMEITACVDGNVEGVWLVEALDKDMHVAVARAVVEPTSNTLPVRILNTSDQPATLYAGSAVATMTPVDPPWEVGAVNKGGEGFRVDQEKQQVLQQLVWDSCTELTSGEKEIFLELLLKYADLLAFSTADLGRTNKLRHKIDTGGAPPIRQPVRRISPPQREQVRSLLGEMLEHEVVEPSSSPWASPVVLVRKKDGSMRFCVDYRRLNEVTRKDAYPLPRIDMTLDSLHGSQWFSTLDLISGYWQVEVEEADREKTAFCTTEGLYQFKVMPFGLCNAPASFQSLMDLVLSGLQWSQCLVYLDDIIVIGRSFAEHISNLNSVLQRLRESGLRLKPAKCCFFQTRVHYLGHIISRDGVATDPQKTDKVAQWPTPTCRREVQQFLGFANYYRRFIRNFAQLARPLHRLNERTATLVWTDQCQDSFDTLRRCLCSSPVLAYPDFSRPFILDTDASDVGIGGVLSQLDVEGRERVVAYGSRLLSKPERRYCVTRRELLAVVVFAQLYRPYLVCQKFTLRTDHGSLTWLRNFREPEGQLARWLEQLQGLEFDIVHRRGTAHQNADGLSRLPCRQCGRPDHGIPPLAEIAVTAMQLPEPHSHGTLREVQLADPLLGPLLLGKEEGKKPPLPVTDKSSRRLLQIWDQLLVKDGVLFRYLQPVDGALGVLQTVVPVALRQGILRDLHGGAAGGHLGADKTLSRLRERFYWPGYFNDVREWCRNCGTCQSRKSPAPKARAPLQPILTSRPLQLVATDILGPLPESPAGNRYILVVADYFTRYVEAYPISDQEATTVARQLVNEFFLRFSPPEQLHSDQGRNFESSVIAEVCRLLGIEKSRTTPYHPQSDGLVERYNRTLLDMLATAVVDRPFEWEQHLRRLCFAYNTSVHPTTGFSPFTLMFGRQARLPVDVALGTSPPPAATIPQYVARLHESLEFAYGCVRDKMGHQLQKQKTRYDAQTQGRPFKVGDSVWLHNPAVPRGRSRKLHRPWTGPYRVAKQLSETVYRLQHSQRPRCRPVVHFNRLKLCPKGTRLPPGQGGRGRVPMQGGDATTPPLPVGSQVELLEDDMLTPGAGLQLSPEAEPQASSPPSTPGRPVEEVHQSATQTPNIPGLAPPCSGAVTSPTFTSPPLDQSVPQNHRYPQRQRSAPVRLYATVGT